jgi:hypothetical protein
MPKIDSTVITVKHNNVKNVLQHLIMLEKHVSNSKNILKHCKFLFLFRKCRYCTDVMA